MCLEAARLQRPSIRMAADGGLSPDHNDFAVLSGGRGRFGTRLHYPDYRNMCCRFNLVQRQRRCRIARDDQHLRAMRLEIMGGFDRVARYSLNRLRAVRESGGVSEIDVVGLRDEFK